MTKRLWSVPSQKRTPVLYSETREGFEQSGDRSDHTSRDCSTAAAIKLANSG
jgi:hypothetical protein